MEKAFRPLISGLKLGHYTDARAQTGCTVLLCEAGAVAGVDVRGSASGTREIAACQPGHLVEKIHAVMISGGSAFGLAAADGAMEYLEQHGVGFDAGVTHVPIVASAIVFDLGVGSPWIRPDRQSGYSACAAARSNKVREGAVGAGTGARVGKLFGVESASQGGFGFSSIQFATAVSKGRKTTRRRMLTVQAFAVVNAFGDVVDPSTGKIIAGARFSPGSRRFAGTYAQMKRGVVRTHFKPENTTIVVVATDAAFDKVRMQKIAQMAQNGLARVLRPAHTMFDGDTVFALSVPDDRHPQCADVNVTGEVAAEAVAEAIVRAVRQE